MASSAMQALGQPTQQQNPREAAMELMKQQGISIPKGMENDPNALLQHVLQSGKIPNNRLNMAQQMMQRWFGRR